MAKRKPKKKATGEPPTCNCLLLCDDVLVSQGKGKHFLQGIIGAIGVPGLPVMLGGYVAYVRLSNVYGSQEVTLQLEEAATEEVLFGMNVKLGAQTDPLGVYNLMIPVPPFVVHRAGTYLFTAVHQGMPITYTPIVIAVAAPPGMQQKERQ